MSEMQVNVRRRARWTFPALIAAALVVAVTIAVAVGIYLARGESGQRANPAPTTSATSVAPSDPHGVEACWLNKQADGSEQLLTEAVVERILAEAQQSNSHEVQFAAQMLLQHRQMATAAKGSDDELIRTLGLTTASIDMQTTCINAGL